MSFEYDAGQENFITVMSATLVTEVAQRERFCIVGPAYKVDQEAASTVFLRSTLSRVTSANDFKIFWISSLKLAVVSLTSGNIFISRTFVLEHDI